MLQPRCFKMCRSSGNLISRDKVNLITFRGITLKINRCCVISLAQYINVCTLSNIMLYSDYLLMGQVVFYKFVRLVVG